MSTSGNGGHVLAVCGSLRRHSSNRAVLEACAQLMPPGFQLQLFDGMADLPAFNPDIEDAFTPEPVLRWRDSLRQSAAILFSTPEYAHGLPGALKNALDWVVGSGETVDKPCAIISSSYRSTFARASLRETLLVMSARLNEEASVTLRLESNVITADLLLADPIHSSVLREAMRKLVFDLSAAPVASP